MGQEEEERGVGRKLAIFTPSAEIPFANPALESIVLNQIGASDSAVDYFIGKARKMSRRMQHRLLSVADSAEKANLCIVYL